MKGARSVKWCERENEVKGGWMLSWDRNVQEPSYFDLLPLFFPLSPHVSHSHLVHQTFNTQTNLIPSWWRMRVLHSPSSSSTFSSSFPGTEAFQILSPVSSPGKKAEERDVFLLTSTAFSYNERVLTVALFLPSGLKSFPSTESVGADDVGLKLMMNHHLSFHFFSRLSRFLFYISILTQHHIFPTCRSVKPEGIIKMMSRWRKEVENNLTLIFTHHEHIKKLNESASNSIWVRIDLSELLALIVLNEFDWKRTLFPMIIWGSGEISKVHGHLLMTFWRAYKKGL